jgi:DNA helicase TIP49 (TBP-interacting protein)
MLFSKSLYIKLRRAMPVHIQDKVISATHIAKTLYHRLVLLVGESGSGKTAVLRAVAEKLGVEVINVNLVLSAPMLEMTVKQRTVSRHSDS